MRRRTIIQAIAAFFAALFSWPLRLGRRTRAVVAELPARIRGKIAPNSPWKAVYPPREVQVTLRVEESRAAALLDHPWATYQDGVLSHPAMAVMEMTHPAKADRLDISNDEAYLATMEGFESRTYTKNRMALAKARWVTSDDPKIEEPKV